jgi:hypothetical protein
MNEEKYKKKTNNKQKNEDEIWYISIASNVNGLNWKNNKSDLIQSNDNMLGLLP